MSSSSSFEDYLYSPERDMMYRGMPHHMIRQRLEEIRYREEERYSYKIPPINFLRSWYNATTAIPAPEKKPNLLLLLEDNI